MYRSFSGVRHTLTLFFLLATKFTIVKADDDQDTSPRDDPNNPLGYISNNVLAAVGLVLMLGVALVHTWLAVRSNVKYMLAMIIGEYCYALGIAFRFGIHSNPDSLGLFIPMYLFITLSPCGFIAAEYVLLGRLARSLQGGHHLLLRPQRVTLVFVISDVATFLIQSFGGGLAASAHSKPSQAATGSHIVLAGLILQLVSFGCFTCLFMHFIYRIRKYEPRVWRKDEAAASSWFNDWRTFAAAMFVSCIGVFVRSVYRSVEYAQGFNGTLSTTEVYFWVLDFIPLYAALLVYIPFWPGKFITPLEDLPAERNAEAPTQANEHLSLDAWPTQSPNTTDKPQSSTTEFVAAYPRQ